MAPLLYALLRGRGGEGELFDSEGRSLRPFTVWQGFLIGWASGIVWYAGTCYWIYPVMHVYGRLPGVAATLITIAFLYLHGLAPRSFCRAGGDDGEKIDDRKSPSFAAGARVLDGH